MLAYSYNSAPTNKHHVVNTNTDGILANTDGPQRTQEVNSVSSNTQGGPNSTPSGPCTTPSGPHNNPSGPYSTPTGPHSTAVVSNSRHTTDSGIEDLESLKSVKDYNDIADVNNQKNNKTVSNIRNEAIKRNKQSNLKIHQEKLLKPINNGEKKTNPYLFQQNHREETNTNSNNKNGIEPLFKKVNKPEKITRMDESLQSVSKNATNSFVLPINKTNKNLFPFNTMSDMSVKSINTMPTNNTCDNTANARYSTALYDDCKHHWLRLYTATYHGALRPRYPLVFTDSDQSYKSKRSMRSRPVNRTEVVEVENGVHKVVSKHQRLASAIRAT
jgi:hypothetical protein